MGHEIKIERERAERFNAKQVAEAAKRVHALQQAALGIKGAPRLEKVEESIRNMLTYEKEYLDQDYFYGAGFVMRIQRLNRPFPTVEFFVPATEAYFVYPEED